MHWTGSTHILGDGPRVRDILALGNLDRRHSDLVVARLLGEVRPNEVERPLSGLGLHAEDASISLYPL